MGMGRGGENREIQTSRWVGGTCQTTTAAATTTTAAQPSFTKIAVSHLGSAERPEPSRARPHEIRLPQLCQARHELYMTGESLGDEDITRGTQNRSAHSLAVGIRAKRRRGAGAGENTAVGAEGSLGKRVGGGGGGHGHDHVRAKDLIGRTRRRKPKMFGAHPVRVSGSHTVNYFVGIWRSTTDNRIKLSCHKKQLDQPCTLPKPGPQNTNRCYTLAMTSFPPPSGFNHSPSSHWEPPSSRLPRSPSTHSKTSRTPSARPGHDESSHASLADRCRPYRGESRSDTARASFSRRSMLHCLRFTWDAKRRRESLRGGLKRRRGMHA